MRELTLERLKKLALGKKNSLLLTESDDFSMNTMNNRQEDFSEKNYESGDSATLDALRGLLFEASDYINAIQNEDLRMKIDQPFQALLTVLEDKI